MIPTKAKYFLVWDCSCVSPLLVGRKLFLGRKKSKYCQKLLIVACQSICFMESHFLTQLTDQPCPSLYPLQGRHAQKQLAIKVIFFYAHASKYCCAFWKLAGGRGGNKFIVPEGPWGCNCQPKLRFLWKAKWTGLDEHRHVFSFGGNTRISPTKMEAKDIKLNSCLRKQEQVHVKLRNTELWFHTDYKTTAL